MAKILYIEDNEDNIYMVSRRLRRKGYEVLIARDGKSYVYSYSRLIEDLYLAEGLK